jgi:excisionase family DNA binding protein
MPDDPDVMNVKQAAEFLGAHIETVRRMARKGELPAYKMGKDWRFRREALLRWTETQHIHNQPVSVLVVDDDSNVRKTVRHILESQGLIVNEAEDGMGGLKWIELKTIAAILLDLKMPDMNGPEFLKILRENNNMVPVIVITGYPDSDLMNEATQYGPFTLLAKPVRKAQLLQAVQTALVGETRRAVG